MNKTKYTLRNAFIEAERIRLSEIPEDSDINWVPSSRFNKRIEKIIKYSNNDSLFLLSNSFKKAVAIVAMIILLLGFSLNTAAAKQSLVRFVVTVYENYTNFFFDVEEKEPDIPKTIEEKYTITAVPEEYMLSSTNELEVLHQLIWTNEKGENILFSQYILQKVSLTLMTGDSPYKYIKIGPYTAFYSTKRNMQTVIWDNGKYLFTIKCTTSIPYKDLIHIAESVAEK